jgi:hypothetical protein
MGKVVSKQVRDTYVCLAFHLRPPCQMSTTCACQVRVPPGLQEGRTEQERALRSKNALYSTGYLYFLNVSCSNFGCSVRVQFWGIDINIMFRMISRIQIKQVDKDDS